MKPLTFTTFLTMLLFSLNVLAGHDASVLRIQTFDQAPIMVEVNGRDITHMPVPFVEITNMAPGKHRVKVYRMERAGRRSFRHELYRGNIMVAPASIVTGVFRYGALTVTNQPIFTAPVCCTGNICHHNNNNYGRNYRDNRYDRYNNYGYDNYNHNYNYDNSHSRGMNYDDFNQLKRMIDRQSFEDSKLKIAKQATRDNYINAAQVRDLLNLFTFESTKLEFAKYAYDKVTDKNRYYTIYDAFTYSSSIDEMERFVR